MPNAITGMVTCVKRPEAFQRKGPVLSHPNFYLSHVSTKYSHCPLNQKAYIQPHLDWWVRSGYQAPKKFPTHTRNKSLSKYFPPSTFAFSLFTISELDLGQCDLGAYLPHSSFKSKWQKEWNQACVLLLLYWAFIGKQYFLSILRGGVHTPMPIFTKTLTCKYLFQFCREKKQRMGWEEEISPDSGEKNPSQQTVWLITGEIHCDTTWSS